MAQRVRKYRHWRQRFNPDAAFVLRRPLLIFGEPFPRGHRLSDEQVLAIGRTKIRRWWESKAIELADFADDAVARPQRDENRPETPRERQESPERVDSNDAPPKADKAPEIAIQDVGGSWYSVTIDGETTKVRGRAAVEALIGRPFESDEADDASVAPE